LLNAYFTTRNKLNFAHNDQPQELSPSKGAHRWLVPQRNGFSLNFIAWREHINEDLVTMGPGFALVATVATIV